MRQNLIELSGLEFRQVPVSCETCGWSGKAGELAVPGASAIANGVTYHCPVCEAAVAHHKGLSDAEVHSEMLQIRRQLRNELRTTLPPTEEAEAFAGLSVDVSPAEPQPARVVPTFDEVRARLRDLY